MPIKNQLATADAQAVEATFEARLAQLAEPAPTSGTQNQHTNGHSLGEPSSQEVIVIGKPVRERDRDHLRLVAAQGCLVCGRSPSDAHHIKFAEQRAMGRKVSDRFAVPICRLHHRELHRRGNERAWWQYQGIDPLVIAADLWGRTHPVERAAPVASRPQNDETKPILGPEAG